MIGKYYQDTEKAWQESCADEKSCRLTTKKEADALLLKRVNTIQRAYKGKNERLYRPYYFFGLKYTKFSNFTSVIYS